MTLTTELMVKRGIQKIRVIIETLIAEEPQSLRHGEMVFLNLLNISMKEY